MIRYALLSDVGIDRSNNEDSAAVDLDLGVFIVADGMGGHAAGEVASRVAVEATITALRARPRPARLRDAGEVLLQAMHDANSAVVREADERGTFGMGTTLSVVFVRRRSAVVAHVGDSRVYSVSKRKIVQLTSDHTLVAAMVDNGVLTADEAQSHPEKHVLTQAIGTLGVLDPQIVQAKIPARGRLLLSTDGLHDALSPEEIGELARIPDLDEATRALVERANAKGGHDNVTVLLVEP
jgi:serine/threonine protein phosphatase PrpC